MMKSNWHQHLKLKNSNYSELAKRDLLDGFKHWKVWFYFCFQELKRRYKRTKLGPLWVTLTMAFFAGAISLVWSNLWNQPVKQYLPFLLSGLIPWQQFAMNLGEGCVAFVAGENQIKSKQFPYSIIIYSCVFRNILLFAHNFLVFIAVFFICNVDFNSNSFYFIPGYFLFIVNLGWITFLVSMINLRFRDFQQVVTVFLQIAMLITPIFWPISQLTGLRSLLYELNPLYHLIVVIRNPLLGETVATHSFIIVILMAIIGWILSASIFIKIRKSIIYWL